MVARIPKPPTRITSYNVCYTKLLRGVRDHLVWIRQRDADALVTHVDRQDPPDRRQIEIEAHPSCIVAKNSWFVLVRFMRSSRNSIASTGGMSDRKLRSR